MSKSNAKILELIKASGLSVRRIANDLQIPEQRMYAWINKGATPSHEDTEKIMRYFDIKEKPPPDEVKVEVNRDKLINRICEFVALNTAAIQVIKADYIDLKSKQTGVAAVEISVTIDSLIAKVNENLLREFAKRWSETS